MSKRIMTVDELYAFCLKNKFSKFDSKEFGKELVVEMPANFAKSDDNTDKMTEGLTPFISRFIKSAFHFNTKIKLSNIKISLTTAKAMLKSNLKIRKYVRNK